MFAHSQANIVNGVENVAFVKYKGDKSHLARTEKDSTKRHFHTFDVEQSTGAKITDHTNATPRYRTFEDTEAKLFESLESIWYNSDEEVMYMLSERGMCGSCKYVAEQFVKNHPEAKVNVVSGVNNARYSWKGRNPYD